MHSVSQYDVLEVIHTFAFITNAAMKNNRSYNTSKKQIPRCRTAGLKMNAWYHLQRGPDSHPRVAQIDLPLISDEQSLAHLIERCRFIVPLLCNLCF